MITILFRDASGSVCPIAATPGLSLMEAARSAGIVGIEAECGGACACATCHVYINPDKAPFIPAATSMEFDMLEFAWAPDRRTSRLSCQIVIVPEMDGLEVTLPERQA
jgi:2Fe-2S ferredoxin